jgi:hypothetical protein
MFDRYIIEIDERAAGILTRAGQAFAFHAVAPLFQVLDGATFPDAFSAERAARRLVRRRERVAVHHEW